MGDASEAAVVAAAVGGVYVVGSDARRSRVLAEQSVSDRHCSSRSAHSTIDLLKLYTSIDGILSALPHSRHDTIIVLGSRLGCLFIPLTVSDRRPAFRSEAEQVHSRNARKVRHLNDKPCTAFDGADPEHVAEDHLCPAPLT